MVEKIKIATNKVWLLENEKFSTDQKAGMSKLDPSHAKTASNLEMPEKNINRA
jgi:hypothetical protein